jgi:hypothetical protein
MMPDYRKISKYQSHILYFDPIGAVTLTAKRLL